MSIHLTKTRATLGLVLTIAATAAAAPVASAGPTLPPPDDQPDPCAPFGVHIPGCNT